MTSFIQSTGQTSMQALHKVHDQLSMMYSGPFFNTESSGQINLQLSQEIQSVFISKYGIITSILANSHHLSI